MTEVAPFPPTNLLQIAEKISVILKQRKETVAVAETASGGLISATLLAIPGASEYFRGGLTLYTLPSRIAYGGWTEENLANYSGPTPQIVSDLAKHVRATLKSTYAIGESGTAGPTGGTARNRTPGYVALAVVFEDGEVTHEVETGTSSRAENMVNFAEEALKLLLRVLEKK